MNANTTCQDLIQVLLQKEQGENISGSQLKRWLFSAAKISSTTIICRTACGFLSCKWNLITRTSPTRILLDDVFMIWQWLTKKRKTKKIEKRLVWNWELRTKFCKKELNFLFRFVLCERWRKVERPLKVILLSPCKTYWYVLSLLFVIITHVLFLVLSLSFLFVDPQL